MPVKKETTPPSTIGGNSSDTSPPPTQSSPTAPFGSRKKKTASAFPSKKRKTSSSDDDNASSRDRKPWTTEERLFLLRCLDDKVVKDHIAARAQEYDLLKIRGNQMVKQHWSQYVKKLIKELEGQTK